MAVDTNYNSVVLLLKCDGANSGTVFTDNSPTPKTVTPTNATTSTAQSKFGGTSASFNGTSAYLSVGSNAALAMGAGDFTIEFWVNPTSLGTNYLFDQRAAAGDTAPVLYYTGSTLLFYTASATRITGGSLSTATWTHVALCRASGVTRLFIGGVVSGSPYTDANTYTQNGVRIGSDYAGANFYNGYLDDIRVTPGVARYTATFTPPTVSHPITNSDPNYGSVVLHLPGDGANAGTVFTDTKGHAATASGAVQTSTTQSKWGGSSITFNGTTDWLTYSSSTDWSIISGNFTVEFWAYFSSSAGNQAFLEIYADANNRWNIGLVGNIQFYSALTGTGSAKITATAPSNNAWHHIALTKSGSTFTLWVDGASAGTSTTTSYHTTTSSLSLGRAGGAPGSPYAGYLDDIRITNGIARYTTAFSVPSGPLPVTGEDANFSNISLLLPADGINGATATDDQAPTTHAITFTNATISTTASKYGGSAVSFNGTSAYISAASSTDFALGSGDFTIEFWVNPTALGTNYLLDLRSAAGDTAPVIYYGAAALKFYTASSDRITGSALSTATWVHIALCRASGTTKLFVSGAQVGSSYTDANTYTQSGVRIGADYSGANFYNGYLDDIRITKGYARYTSAFTVPLGANPLTGPPATTPNLFAQRIIAVYDANSLITPIAQLYL